MVEDYNPVDTGIGCAMVILIILFLCAFVVSVNSCLKKGYTTVNITDSTITTTHVALSDSGWVSLEKTEKK